VTVNGNTPDFPDDVYSRAGLVSDGGTWKTEGSKSGKIESGKLNPYEYYGELDGLGRCTVAYGCLGEETMPAEGTERGDISRIHPSGWAKAQNWERCHLIAWALSDENANERNLVTGTHYLNHDGMRPLEEEVEHYIWNTGNHVLYMSRPLFSGNELIPRGVQMTVWSCEDQGKGMSFNVYCFNVTPGAEINYVNGVVTTEEQAQQEPRLYVVNKRSGVFHYPTCEGAHSIYKKNRMEVTATRKELTDQGYVPCGYCEP
jgi:DNA-entry nuclease